MKKILILTTLLLTNSCFGYFYHAEELTNGDQNIHLLWDVHSPQPYDREDKKAVCDKQRTDLLSNAKQRGGMVIVEDGIFSIQIFGDQNLFAKIISEMKHDFIKDPISFNPNRDYSHLLPEIDKLSDNIYIFSPLTFFAQYCYRMKIPVINIECRFLPDTHLITDLINFYNERIKEVKSYNDGQVYNKIYEQKMSEFDQEHQKWRKFLSDAMEKSGPRITTDQVVMDEKFNLFDYGIGVKPSDANFKAQVKSKKENFVNAHDSLFIDLRILHHISCSKHKNIFICAGGTHIENVRECLTSQLGFRTVRKSENEQKDLSIAINLEKFFAS